MSTTTPLSDAYKAEIAAARNWRRLDVAAAAYCICPLSFRHLEPHYNDWRRRNPGKKYPLDCHIHAPSTFEYSPYTDMAGTA